MNKRFENSTQAISQTVHYSFASLLSFLASCLTIPTSLLLGHSYLFLLGIPASLLFRHSREGGNPVSNNREKIYQKYKYKDSITKNNVILTTLLSSFSGFPPSRE